MPTRERVHPIDNGGTVVWGFQPHKDRCIRLGEPADLYRNLNRGNGIWYSIRQNGLVVGHCRHAYLADARPHVNVSAQQAIAAGGPRTVHAWVRGQLVGSIADGTRRVHYRPHLSDQFHYSRPGYPGEVGPTWTGSPLVLLTDDGMWEAVP